LNNISYLVNKDNEEQLNYYGEPIDYFLINKTTDTVCVQSAAFAILTQFDSTAPLEIYTSDGETKKRLAYITCTQDLITFFPLIDQFQAPKCHSLQRHIYRKVEGCFLSENYQDV
jgi:hypothetical protein